jgi:hypothetical protein
MDWHLKAIVKELYDAVQDEFLKGIVLDLVSQVRDVVLMNVYLDLGNPGGSGFWNEG